jgi:DNA repair protein RecO (recombination protein O)
MSLRQTLDAIVLRTVDVGEADRFCVLFTRERGRVAARARAVRKTSSRMGGSLLPMQRVQVDVTEQGNGMLITGASQDSHQSVTRPTFSAFLEHIRGIDLLLALTEDDEPMPPVFTLLCTFLDCAPDDLPGLLPAFQARLLHLLGLLPAFAEDARIRDFPLAVQAFLQAAVSPLPFAALAELAPHHRELPMFLEGLIDEHAARPMKSRMVGV